MRAEVEKTFNIKCRHEVPNYAPCSGDHEHEYEITINVHAWMKEDTGMVLDYKEMDEIISKYADKDLNDIMEIPTVENFALSIAEDVIARLQHYSRVSITIKESENTKVTITR